MTFQSLFSKLTVSLCGWFESWCEFPVFLSPTEIYVSSPHVSSRLSWGKFCCKGTNKYLSIHVGFQSGFCSVYLIEPQLFHVDDLLEAAEIPSLKSRTSILPCSKSIVLSVILSVVIKAGSDRCDLPVKTRGDKEEEEAAVAKPISVDATSSSCFIRHRWH